MSENVKRKFISDTKIKKSDSFPKALENLDLDTLNNLLDSQPHLVNQRDLQTGWTLLSRAVTNENFALTEFLLEKREADPNLANLYGETPLHQAVENSNHKLINLLLEKGADPNLQNEEGETPMHIAALKGEYKVVKLLHLYGADPTILTHNDYSSLDYAREKGNIKCIQSITDLMEKNSSEKLENNMNFNNDSLEDKMMNLQNIQNIQNFQNLQNIQNLQNLQNFQNFHSLQNLQTYDPNNDLNRNYNTTKNQTNTRNAFISNYMSIKNELSDYRREKNRSFNNLNSQIYKDVHFDNSHNINNMSDLEEDDCNYNKNNQFVRGDVHHHTYSSVEEDGMRARYNKGKADRYPVVVTQNINKNFNHNNRSQNYSNQNQFNSINNSDQSNETGKEASFLHQMNNFEERLERIKKELMDNVMSNTQDTNKDKKENLTVMSKNNNPINIGEIQAKYPVYNPSKNSEIIPSINTNLNMINNPNSLGMSTDVNNFSPNKSKKINYSKKHGYSSATLPSYLNYDNLINNHKSRKQSVNNRSRDNSLSNLRIQIPSSNDTNSRINIDNIDNIENIEKVLSPNGEGNNSVCIHSTKHKEQEDLLFTLNYESNQMLTLRGEDAPNDNDDTVNINCNDEKENDCNFNFMQTESFENTSKIKFNNTNKYTSLDDVYNLPLKRDSSSTSNYNNLSKTNETANFLVDANSNTNRSNKTSKIPPVNSNATDIFTDYNKVLAVFVSSPNDIDENYSAVNKSAGLANKNGFNTTLSKSLAIRDDLKNSANTLNKTGDMFNFNINEMNEFITNTDPDRVNTVNTYESGEEETESDEEGNKFVDHFLAGNTGNNNNNNNLSYSIANNTSKPNNFNFFSNNFTENNILSRDTLEKINLPLMNNVEYEYNSTEAVREVNSFLKSVDLEKYTPLFIKNGFDDLKIVIDQMKSDEGITDLNLKEIGIELPGHRAKILLKLEEECHNFEFNIPNQVFYRILDPRPESLSTDVNVKAMTSWLRELKMEQYLSNFLSRGYHCMELLYMQMLSKNPISDKLLEEDLHVSKIGYRIRILNKLREDAKIYKTKLKTKLKMSGNKEIVHESCKCLIF